MNWLQRIMIGRNGPDPLSFALLLLSMLLSIFSRIKYLSVLSILSYAVLVYCIYRMLSRNIVRRQAENQKFMALYNPVAYKVRSWMNRFHDYQHYKYFKCPNCKMKLRAPRGRGKISVTCQRCKTVFQKKT